MISFIVKWCCGGGGVETLPNESTHILDKTVRKMEEVPVSRDLGRKKSVIELKAQLDGKIPFGPPPISPGRRPSEPCISLNRPTKPPLPPKPPILRPLLPPKPTTFAQIGNSVPCSSASETSDAASSYSDSQSSAPSEFDFDFDEPQNTPQTETPRPGEGNFDFEVSTPTPTAERDLERDMQRVRFGEVLNEIFAKHLNDAGVKEEEDEEPPPTNRSVPSHLMVGPKPPIYIPSHVGGIRSRKSKRPARKAHPKTPTRKPSFTFYDDDEPEKSNRSQTVSEVEQIGNVEKRTNYLLPPSPGCSSRMSEPVNDFGAKVSGMSRPKSEPALNDQRDSGFIGSESDIVVSEVFQPASDLLFQQDEPDTDAVDGESDEDKRLRKLKYAAAEFLSTEKTHIDSLKKLGKVFPGFMRDSAHEDEKEFTELETAAINTIEKHMLCIIPTHEAIHERFTIAMENWNSENPYIAAILSEYAQVLKCCAPLLKDKMDISNKLLLCQKEDDKFKAMCRQFDRCAFNGLPLISQLDCVHQRVMRYPLLLQAYLKYLVPDSEEYKRTEEATQKTVAVANELDKLLVDFYSFDDMLLLGKRLQGAFNVFHPGRKLKKQGPIKKQSRKEIQDRYLILFSDRLLYCRLGLNDTLEIGLTFELNPNCMVKPVEHEDFQTEFVFQHLSRSLIFIAKDKKERNHWVEAIRRTVDEALLNKGTLPTTSTDVIVGALQTQLGDPSGWIAPPWRPDKSVTMCQVHDCNASFTTIKRRHHCRCCGNVICSECSGGAPLCYTQFKTRERVCCECYYRVLSMAKKGKFDDQLRSLGILRSNLKPKFKAPKNGSLSGFRPKPVPPEIVPSPSDDGAVTGYLHRWDDSKREWKKFWAKLHDFCVLELYLAPNDNVSKEKMVLHGFELKVTEESSITNMEIIHKNQFGPTAMSCTLRAYTPQSANKWATALQKVYESQIS